MNAPAPSSVAIRRLIQACPFPLDWWTPAEPDRIVQVDNYIHRPGLLLAGYLPQDRCERHILVFGGDEFRYLQQQPAREQARLLEVVWSLNPPLVIVCGREVRVSEAFRKGVETHQIPVLHTPVSSKNFLGAGFRWIERLVAPRVRINANLVSVFGLGVLMVGASGVGKSECTLELLARGHRLVADDAVVLTGFSSGEVLGRAPEMGRGLMEIRGLGLVDTRVLFGPLVLQPEAPVDLVIELAVPQGCEPMERLGMTFHEPDRYTVPELDVTRPKITLPVIPGRNLGILVEMAVRWFMLRHLHSVRIDELYRAVEPATPDEESR